MPEYKEFERALQTINRVDSHRKWFKKNLIESVDSTRQSLHGWQIKGEVPQEIMDRIYALISNIKERERWELSQYVNKREKELEWSSITNSLMFWRISI